MPDSSCLDKKQTAAGVVHGHIHNYNNLVYIHGHVHHEIPSSKQYLNSENPNSINNKDKDNTCPTQEQINNESIHNDCKPFEFFDFHNNGESNPFNTFQLDLHTNSNNNTINIPNTSNHPLKRKFEELDDNILSTLLNQNNKKLSISSTESRSNNTTTIDECNPKIFEICCDIDHNKNNITATLDSTLDGINPTSGFNNRVTNILTNPQKPSSSSSSSLASSETGITATTTNTTDSYNKNKAGYHNTISNAIDLQNNLKYLSDLNCNFDCGFDCENITKNKYTKTNNRSYDQGNFYDRYCQLCENDSPHEQHVYDQEKTPYTNTTISNDSNNVITSTNKNNSFENSSDNDMKILQDLCNISSLYEVPFAQHMSHHHQQQKYTSNNNSSNTGNKPVYDGTTSNGNKNSVNAGHRTQNHSASNLLEPVIKSRFLDQLNTERNGDIHGYHQAQQEQHDHHHHHHHKIELHTHVPMINNPMTIKNPITYNTASSSNNNNIINNITTKPTILNNAINFHVDSKMDPQDENSNYKSNLIPNVKSEPISDGYTLLSDNSNKNDNLNELNTIDFNWNFKNDNVDDMKCLWDDCENVNGFNNLIDLQKHMFVDHIPNTSSKDFKCHWQDCAFQGNDVCSLVNHVNDQHGIKFGIKINEPTPNPRIEGEGQEEESYRCQWDGCHHEGKFTSQELNEHVESEHVPRRQSHYTCNWYNCNKHFTQRQKLLRHIKVHTGYKPYCCKICNRKFANQETLIQHNRTHSGEKPYKCHVCGKCFGGSSSLKIHIRTHTGEKPLECPICGKRFNESSNLNKHMKTHSKDFYCPHCGKQFATWKTLKAHEVSKQCLR